MSGCGEGSLNRCCVCGDRGSQARYMKSIKSWTTDLVLVLLVGHTRPGPAMFDPMVNAAETVLRYSQTRQFGRVKKKAK